MPTIPEIKPGILENTAEIPENMPGIHLKRPVIGDKLRIP